MGQQKFDEDIVELGRLVVMVAEQLELPNVGVMYDRVMPYDPITPRSLFSIIDAYNTTRELSRDLMEKRKELEKKLTARKMLDLRIAHSNKDLFYGLVTYNKKRKPSKEIR